MNTAGLICAAEPGARLNNDVLPLGVCALITQQLRVNTAALVCTAKNIEVFSLWGLRPSRQHSLVNTAVLMYTGRTGETLNLLRRSLFGACALLASARWWVPLCESALRDWGKHSNIRGVLPLWPTPLSPALAVDTAVLTCTCGQGAHLIFQGVLSLGPASLSPSLAGEYCRANLHCRTGETREYLRCSLFGVCIPLANTRW